MFRNIQFRSVEVPIPMHSGFMYRKNSRVSSLSDLTIMPFLKCMKKGVTSKSAKVFDIGITFLYHFIRSMPFVSIKRSDQSSKKSLSPSLNLDTCSSSLSYSMEVVMPGFFLVLRGLFRSRFLQGGASIKTFVSNKNVPMYFIITHKCDLRRLNIEKGKITFVE